MTALVASPMFLSSVRKVLKMQEMQCFSVSRLVQRVRKLLKRWNLLEYMKCTRN